MSGTSLDGVDAALIETDGQGTVIPQGFLYVPYPDDLRARVKQYFGTKVKTPETDAAERELTVFHADVVEKFLVQEKLDPSSIDVIGFHGQTLYHDPDNKFTWQIGDGKLLASETGITTVNDFRTNDVNRGGQGAPLMPIYHYARARASNLKRPVAILNIGGVSSVTYIDGNEDDLITFDCGPGNALIDDLIFKATGERFDKDAKWARQGKPDKGVLDRWLAHEYFERPAPKSLDRDAWDVKTISNFELPTAAATLTAFTVDAIAKGVKHFPEAPKEWYITGGGRRNPAMMEGLKNALKVPVHPVDQIGWDGDALEAEGFAYMAVRKLLDLPISFPKTTGCPTPLTGGSVYKKN